MTLRCAHLGRCIFVDWHMQRHKSGDYFLFQQPAKVYVMLNFLRLCAFVVMVTIEFRFPLSTQRIAELSINIHAHRMALLQPVPHIKCTQ